MDIVLELLLEKEQALLEKLGKVRSALAEHGHTSRTSATSIINANTGVSKTVNGDLIDAYDIKEYTVPQKMLYALKENKRFMKIREIAEFLSSITKENPDELTKQLSRRTKFLKDKGKITKHQHGNRLRDTFWGSPKWLDSEGNIRKEYEFNTSIIDKEQDFSDIL